jgi:hypothetical protein
LKQISLTQGKFALVDDEDYDWLLQWKWYAYESSGNFYAGRQQRKLEYGNGKRKFIPMHRAIMEYHGFDIKNKLIDHRNHETLNNRKKELRICNHKENVANRKPKETKLSKYKGVYWNDKNNKWGAHLQNNKERKFLGYFNTELEAAVAYNKAALEYHKEFACLNKGKELIDIKSERIFKDKNSKYKGIHWCKRDKKWIARITFKKETICIGYFDIEEDAARAYDLKALELLGEKAKTNFKWFKDSLIWKKEY